MRNDHSIDDFELIKIEGYKTEKVLVTYWVFLAGRDFAASLIFC